LLSSLSFNFTLRRYIKGKIGKFQNRAVLICASSDGDGDVKHDSIAAALSELFDEECADSESVLFDDDPSSAALASDVAATLGWDAPSLTNRMDALQAAGVTIMFATSPFIHSVVERTLQMDEGRGARFSLSYGGITVIDFSGGVESATIACINHTAHL
jgi:hypothetical protein